MKIFRLEAKVKVLVWNTKVSKAYPSKCLQIRTKQNCSVSRENIQIIFNCTKKWKQKLINIQVSFKSLGNFLYKIHFYIFISSKSKLMSDVRPLDIYISFMHWNPLVGSSKCWCFRYKEINIPSNTCYGCNWFLFLEIDSNQILKLFSLNIVKIY